MRLAALAENNDSGLIPDEGAGIGPFPADPALTQSFTQNFALTAAVPEGFSLSEEARASLEGSEAYQQLMAEMTQLAGGILSSALVPLVREPAPSELPKDLSAPALEDVLNDVPAPGRKRNHSSDNGNFSKKSLLEIAPPSTCQDPLKNNVEFRDNHAALTEELIAEISLRPSLQAFSDADAHFTAYLLVRGGLTSISSIKLSLAINRKYFLQDLRDENLSHRDLLFLLKIFEVFPPTSKNRNVKHPEFEEVCIPLRLNKMNLPLVSLSGLLIPDQRMVNEISELLARGQATSPPYTPYAFMPLNKEPWAPALFERKKSIEGWNSRMTTLKSDQSLSFQAWILYRLRFCFSAAACGAWDLYGGLIGQINNIGVILNLAVVENVGVALKYFDFLHTQLESSARSRAADVDYFKLLSEEQIDIRRRFAKPVITTENSHARLQGKNSSRSSYEG